MLWICKASKLGALTHNKHVQTPQNPPWKDSETTEQSKTNGESSMTLRRFHPTHPQHIGVVFRGECMYAIHGVYMSVWDGYFLTLLVVNPHGANWAFLVEASGGTRCHLEATDRPHNWTWIRGGRNATLNGVATRKKMRFNLKDGPSHQKRGPPFLTPHG